MQAGMQASKQGSEQTSSEAQELQWEGQGHTQHSQVVSYATIDTDACFLSWVFSCLQKTTSLSIEQIKNCRNPNYSVHFSQGAHGSIRPALLSDGTSSTHTKTQSHRQGVNL